jgi:hypothetical protein
MTDTTVEPLGKAIARYSSCYTSVASRAALCVIPARIAASRDSVHMIAVK